LASPWIEIVGRSLGSAGGCSLSHDLAEDPAGREARRRSAKAASASHAARRATYLAYRINKGHYGATSLDGAKF
jgi:lipid-binding SYLF domain-containing protein